MRFSHSWLLLPLFLVGAILVGAVFRYPLVLDDPFITYRYARNLIEGQGMLYNPGEHVLSTTTPLYALTLAALGSLYPNIPELGFWLSVVCFGVCAFFLYRIAEWSGFTWGGIAAGLVVLVSPALVLSFGMETGLYLLLAAGGFYFYLRRRLVLAFALLALLTLTRNDGVLLALILTTHYFWTRHRAAAPLNLKFLLVYFGLVAPWLLFAWWWFGSPFPFTLTAKIAQAQSGLWDTFAVGLAKWAAGAAEWLAPLAVMAAISVLAAGRFNRPVNAHAEQSELKILSASGAQNDSPPRAIEHSTASTMGIGANLGPQSLVLFALWAAAHLLAYSALGVAFYAWYAAPLIPALALFGSIGAEAVGAWMGARAGRAAVGRVVVTALVGALLVGLELRADVAAGMTRPSPKVEAYRRAAEWLSNNTPLDASVDALEVGVIGYYDRRRTVDFVGLVDPRRVPYLRAREFAAGVRRAAAEYVVAIPPDTWLPADLWFPNAYQPAQRIRVPGFYGNQPLVIYRRADEGRPPVESRQVNLAFDGRVELSSVDLYAHEMERGQTLPLRLNLRARTPEPIPARWKFTVQLVGAADRVVAQTDTFYPARLPEDSLPFADYQGVPIAPDAPPGNYTLIVALYDEQTGERVSLFDANGNEVTDFVDLGEIKIKD